METWRERSRRIRAQQRRWKQRLLTKTLTDCEVWPALVNNLRDYGITTLGDLTRRTRAEVAAIPYIGVKKMQELDAALYRYDLEWAPEARQSEAPANSYPGAGRPGSSVPLGPAAARRTT